MFQALALISIVAVLYYWYRSRNVSYWSKKNVPSFPGCHWFWGHFKEGLAGTKHIGLLITDMYNAFPDAPLVGYVKLSVPGLTIRDPDLVKSVLMADFSNFAKNDLNINKKKDILFGRNPFVCQGEEWKVARGHSTPAVTLTKLKGYLPTILQVGDVMVKYIKDNFDEKGRAEFEAKELGGTFTTDVVANAVCGIESNTFEDKGSLFGNLTKEIFSNFAPNRFNTFIELAFPEIHPGVQIISDHSTELIVTLTRAMLKKKSESTEARSDLFQQMLTNRKNDTNGVFTDEYIASHVTAFILDGYETSSIVICYALYELAWNEHAQDKLREEIRNLKKSEYTVEDVEGCKYLDRVVSESLRLHPPVLALSKVCTSDYTILNPYFKRPLKIKKGTLITIPVHALHMDEKYYENPKNFDPERFTEEAVAARDKYVYLPFGEGPRRCLGARFGLLQTKVALMKIIENFRVKPSPKTDNPVDIDPQMLIINRPLNGAWITIEKLG